MGDSVCCANVRTWVRFSSIRVKGQVCACVCNLSVSGTGGSGRLSQNGELPVQYQPITRRDEMSGGNKAEGQTVEDTMCPALESPSQA